MPPFGGRQRPQQQHPAQGRPGAHPPSRNEAFENIFGRSAGGHHLGGGGGAGGPPPPRGPPGHRPQVAPGHMYSQFAPPMPPVGAPSYPRGAYGAPPGPQPSGPQPSYPPPMPQHAPARQYPNQPPPGYAPADAYGADPYAPRQPQPQPQQQQMYDAVPPPPPQNMNGFPRPQIGGPGAPPSGFNEPPQPRTSLPNRRASLTPSLAPSMYSNAPSGYAPNMNAGPGPARPPQTSYNGFVGGPNDRLPHISVLEQHEDDAYSGIVGGPSPSGASGHNVPLGPGSGGPGSNRSVSATSSSTASTITHAPPRSRSLNRPGPGQAHGAPSAHGMGTHINTNVSSASPPTSGNDTPVSPADYVRMMNSMSVSGRGTPGPLDDIAGIPDRNSSDLGSLKGPWEPTPEPTQQRPKDTRHLSSGSSQSNFRTLHHRMPSDSSIASSVYTVAGRGVAPLSQIGTGYIDTPMDSPSTPTGSENNYNSRRLSARKSMDSTHSLPLPNSTNDSPLPPGAANSAFDNRAMSFSGSGVNRRDIVSQVRSSQGSLSDAARGLGLTSNSLSPVASQRSLVRKQSQTQRQAALLNIHVVPALLSTVAEAFRQLVQPTELHKDGITYKDAFDGRTAVTIIADIIKTPDRNLALLLGRALDAQKFFHDVTYLHRLRDTPNEVYQFRERLVEPFNKDDTRQMDSPSSDHLTLTRPPSTSSANRVAARLTDSESSSYFPPTGAKASPGGAPTPIDSDDSDDDLPNGVFTLLTDCYSPTCTRERLCYSINCPRRLEQMKRLNMKSAHPGLSRKIEEVIHDDSKDSSGTLWIHTVSQDILDLVDDTEKKRQEAINEVIYTERDFVRDLEYLRDSWVKPLRTLEIIEASRRDDFVRQVFWNVHDVLKINHVLAEHLTKRQKQQPIVQAIGDIFLDCVPHFTPFVAYGAHQLFGKYEFEKEKGSNPAFQKFVDETERKPESRKLELNGYLTKPTTRLGRYPLLLEAVLKYTPEDHPDKHDLPKVIKMIREYLSKVNEESGKAENVFELAQLEKQLVFRQHENYDLRLRDKSRELIHKGPMKRRGGNQGENADLLAFLFDHAFLLVKSKWVNKAEQYKVYRRPIPLELLVLTTPEDYSNSKLTTSTRGKLISRNNTKTTLTSAAHIPPKPESKHGFSLHIQHLGRKGYSFTLWVETYVSRKKWVEMIEKQQQIIRERTSAFVPETITDGFFGGLRRINCISPYDNGNRMIYGTDEGVYFSNLRDPKLREPVKVINLVDVTQVDVIEEYQLLVVLHERSVTTFPLDCLDPNDPNAALKRAKRISSHTSFFKSGVCLGRTLVAVVKSSALSSTIKVLEPIEQSMRGKKQQGGFMKRLNGGQETLKVFKEFYIPLESFSVYFLKTKLCVGCQKGFEIVDLETLDMQSLLDPSDAALDFVLKREGVKPMAIYRVESDFLLCYDDFAFYVNKNGWRSRQKWAIIWEGNPTSFAMQYPFVIAFDPSFVEIRHVETGGLVQVIPGGGISCLFADMPPSTVNAPPPPRQQMYPGAPPGNPYGRPPPNYPHGGGYPGGPPGAPGFPQPHPYGGGAMVRPPMGGGYGMPAPMPPIRNFAFRPQIIFTSDDGHVQFLKLQLPQKNRRLSESRSMKSFVR